MSIKIDCPLKPAMLHLLQIAGAEQTLHSKELATILGMATTSVDTAFQRINHLLDVDDRGIALHVATINGWIDVAPSGKGPTSHEE